ncbi:membrane-bound transcription factor site-2 protease-like [Dendronephthya gigantea]|uniref:membrane-bound transcription factor site-2 protease-like n=1 Tax=Dendronephthya gigantea TaxID=151771 RepID=UPI00106B4E70|nr:membrane-bound transcription factor site-2 protease-like [Dendronephthya gigantea]
MTHIPAVILLFLFWSLLYLGDSLLKKFRRLSRAYRELLDQNGLSFSFGHVRWYTTKFNRCFFRWGKYHPTLARVWFSVGAYFGVSMMAISVVILSWTLAKAFRNSSPEQFLTPVMPGVNLPWSHIVYYLVTLTLAGIVHEVGHALAAVREQVRVNGFGIFFMVLYPGAFVDLYTEHLAVISAVRQLRIYCAGVWHNFILVLIAVGLLWLLPSILSLGYVSNQGAVVLQLMKGSAVENSLTVGDYITSVDKCKVTNAEDWKLCLKRTIYEAQHGFCTDMMTMTRKNIFLGKESNVHLDCCGNLKASRLCFSYHSSLGQKGLSCLPARTMVSNKMCNDPNECPGTGEKVCIHPSIDNSSRLIKISHYRGEDVLYVGDPHLLYFSVFVGTYLPVFKFLPLSLPVILETLFMYIISLSSALALLNAAPCYWLDGQWILYALVDYSLGKYLPDVQARNTICTVILTAGTFFLVSNILLALWTLGNIT